MQSETLELLEWSRLCRHLSTFAATKLGAIAASHLVIPQSYDRSQELLTQTKEAYYLETKLSGGLSLEGVQDISGALARAEVQGVLSPLELFAIATTLAGARNLRRSLDNAENCPALQALVSDVRTYPDLEKEIYHCIEEGGTVLERASEKLGNIRRTSHQVREKIINTLQGIIQRKNNALQENIITQRGDRYVLSVKASHKDQIQGIVHDASGSGLTLLIEPSSVVAGNNDLRQLVAREQREIEIILTQLSAKVTAVAEDLSRLLAILTEIDLAIARARYAYWLKANPPNLSKSQPQSLSQNPQLITLRNLRHPLLVWQEQQESGRTVVPVDILISPEIKVVVITGPNTGGKTATLKTFGLAAIMAKAGMFIPAPEPVEIPWFDLILADIGDEQSLQQNLSTFSGHIRRIGRILELITPASLVLLDEVGAGTDPSEGSAIATALLEHLANHANLTIATTHFGELKTLKYQNPQFENASVEFDDVQLAPTYKLLWGIPGRSNALAIARRLGLPEDIISSAQNHVGYGSSEINLVIAELETQRRQQTEKTQAATILLAEMEKLHKEISDKSQLLRSQYQELRAKQEIEVTAAINQAKKEIARVIRKLQAGDQSPQSAQHADNRMTQISKMHLPSQQKQPQANLEPIKYIPKLGDQVKIIKLNKIGQVLSTGTNNSNEIGVRVGGMKMTVKIEDIEAVKA
ncbi:MutS2 family protein [Synechococcus sp. PCC 7502]|uniref:endonuclease MutS2 n=1 Tax=Synechococcus sp. PCC 7502 TaxID=1173263 RepID=UPI00029F8481|nr:endonuclease MutS2 [Synechococcus sp. PCC 7502]AFY72353.1 MutS2 family protein [Synechococcus sp. PCC 7502]